MKALIVLDCQKGMLARGDFDLLFPVIKQIIPYILSYPLKMDVI